MVLAAVVMGLPTLKGTFVGADDHRLVRNHVLVSYPSLAHAAELLAINHRDLYQPLPLLSFSAEFAVAKALGLYDQDAHGGDWLFHLTNILLHAANAVLVWLVVVTLSRRVSSPRQKFAVLSRVRATMNKGGGRRERSVDKTHLIATVAAIVFAVHPFQMEVVAWVNGRMMLLSTLFALAAVVALGQWFNTGRRGWAIWVVLFVLFSATSKIRVGLPLLLWLVPLAQRRKPTRGFLALWAICAAVTAGLAVINYQATSEAGMFSGAVANLHGPRVIRALLALAFYFQHMMLPVGLASWYPTPGLVGWAEPETIRAMAIVLPTAALCVWAAFRHPEARWGLAWFAATMAVTVQLVPTRNALAADRYMYLPMVGLCWILGWVICSAFDRAKSRVSETQARAGGCAAGLAVCAVLIGIGWHTASFYENPVAKTYRIASLYPNTAYVWERAGGALQQAGRPEEAIEYAEKEFAHDAPGVRSAAYAVIGAARYDLGQVDEAIAAFRQAIEISPDETLAQFQLARVLAEVGRTGEALDMYEAAVEIAPLYDAGSNRLATLYRRLGRPDDARKTYERVLGNNSYDVVATMSLAELDIEAGGKKALESARQRLESLLSWRSDDVDALVNLSVVYHGLGDDRRAMAGYKQVLAIDRHHATAAFNLAGLYHAAGKDSLAWKYFESGLRAGPESVEQVITAHDFLVSRREFDQVVALWTNYVVGRPEDRRGRVFLVWAKALAEDPTAAQELERFVRSGEARPLTTASKILTELVAGRGDELPSLADKLCGESEAVADARERLLSSFEAYDVRHPDDAWAYCLVAILLLCENRIEDAGVFLDLCDRHCRAGDCREQVERLRVRIGVLAGDSASPSVGQP